jgi:hypothetical protein
MYQVRLHPAAAHVAASWHVRPYQGIRWPPTQPPPLLLLLLPALLLLLRGVSGEIREKTLEALPSASMYMGRTQLSLADIRRYNSAQGSLMYTLHDNDCR